MPKTKRAVKAVKPVKPKAKKGKPLHVDMTFEETLARIVNVNPKKG